MHHPQPTLTETVLDASRTRVIRTREDGDIEDLTAAAPVSLNPARRTKAAATSQEVINDADPT